VRDRWTPFFASRKQNPPARSTDALYGIIQFISLFSARSPDAIPRHKTRNSDVRVRRALTLAIDRWGGAPQLAKIENVRTVGGIVFPGSPLAADKEELQAIAGYWPDIVKLRVKARRLLHEAGAEGLGFELVNRNIDQPYKYDATWLIDQWSKIGL
jgi:peptide/nickel transport system substrate-binding protein